MGASTEMIRRTNADIKKEQKEFMEKYKKERKEFNDKQEKYEKEQWYVDILKLIGEEKKG